MANVNVLLEYKQDLINFVYTNRQRGVSWERIRKQVKDKFRIDVSVGNLKKIVAEIDAENEQGLKLLEESKAVATQTAYNNLLSSSYTLQSVDDLVLSRIIEKVQTMDENTPLRDLVLAKQLIDNTSIKTIELALKAEEVKIKQLEANITDQNENVIIVNDLKEVDVIE